MYANDKIIEEEYVNITEVEIDSDEESVVVVDSGGSGAAAIV